MRGWGGWGGGGGRGEGAGLFPGKVHAVLAMRDVSLLASCPLPLPAGWLPFSYLRAASACVLCDATPSTWAAQSKLLAPLSPNPAALCVLCTLQERH